MTTSIHGQASKVQSEESNFKFYESMKKHVPNPAKREFIAHERSS